MIQRVELGSVQYIPEGSQGYFAEMGQYQDSNDMTNKTHRVRRKLASRSLLHPVMNAIAAGGKNVAN